MIFHMQMIQTHTKIHKIMFSHSLMDLSIKRLSNNTQLLQAL